jgi:hypothetical protein
VVAVVVSVMVLVVALEVIEHPLVHLVVEPLLNRLYL